jgi:hypothetical protein
MGFYFVTCDKCGGPATFCSVWPMSYDCKACRARAEFLRLLLAATTRPGAGKPEETP